jgi:hypothetical protein
MAEIILAALMKNKIQGGRISAVHGHNQNNPVITAHFAVQAVNIIFPVLTYAAKAFIFTSAAGMRIQFPEPDYFVITGPCRRYVLPDLITISILSARKTDNQIIHGFPFPKSISRFQIRSGNLMLKICCPNLLYYIPLSVSSANLRCLASFPDRLDRQIKRRHMPVVFPALVCYNFPCTEWKIQG